MNLRRRTFATARLTVLRLVVVNAMQFVQIALLARYLSPSDFGTVALVVATLTLCDAFSKTGIDLAIVRHAGDPTPLLDAGWTLHVCRGVGLAIVVLLASPFIARLGDSESLIGLLLAACVVPIIDGTQNIGPVLAIRNLDQRRLTMYDIATSVTGAAIAIGLAVTLRNPWAIVSNMIAFSVLRWIASYRIHPYRPKLTRNWTALRGELHFSIYMNLVFGTNYLILSIDKFFISAAFGSEPLGFYERAFLLSYIVVMQFAHLLSSTVTPGFAELKGYPDRFRHHSRRYLGLVLGVFATFAILLHFGAPWIVAGVYGEQFTASIPLLERLAWFTGFYGASLGVQSLFVVLGRPRLTFGCNVIHLVAFLIAILAAQPWSLVSFCNAMAIGAATSFGAALCCITAGGLIVSHLPAKPSALTQKREAIEPDDIHDIDVTQASDIGDGEASSMNTTSAGQL